MLISIRERAKVDKGWQAALSFDGQGEFPLTVTDPFQQEDEERLEWYFERHLEKPFLGKVMAEEAAASVATYGTALFESVFADRNAYARYSRGRQAGVNTLRFEIVGSPEFHGLHWEALRDPDMEQPLAVHAAFARKHNNPQVIEANIRSSPTINVLVVTARSGAKNEVGYRTISRPLVEALRQADVRVQIDILRPGTYEALVKHLDAQRDAQGAGYYHVIHFDTHGALLPYSSIQQGIAAQSLFYKAPFGRKPVQPYDGMRAYLFLAGDEAGQYDAVWADDLAGLLKTQQIPIAILNACQSARQMGSDETSLGSRLMQAGAQVALAMSYSVTVSAAERLMTTLYQQLFAHADLPNAIRQARAELYNVKTRRAYYNRTIDLEDWLLPVVYQNSDVQLTAREFTPQENTAYYKALAEQYDYPHTQYGFVGRDLDILNIETRLLTKGNLLLVRGMGGAGKSTLLRYLGAWWQQTRFVEKVFYFGYDERAHTRQQILNDLARQLLTDVEFARDFQPLPLNAQQKLLAGRLRGQRHLLILDNLESITGEPLAIPNTLPPDEQAALHSLLRDLQGGKTLVLLGSRSDEAWLSPGTFEDNVYDLSGLDPEAASTLADSILKRLHVEKYREDPDFLKLLALLDGFPLALQVTLANLKQQTPADVLAAFQAGYG